MGNHYSSCEFNVISYGTQRCVGIIFVVIGKQQWGDIVDGTNTFTVAFTSFCKIANAGNYSWGGVDNIIRSIELTYFTATYTDNSYPFLYIAIGQQQWGDTTVSMPLFPAEAFNIAIWDDSNATHVGFDISSLYGRYFICSKQQWGYGTAGTITYPIQFTEIAYTAFACDIAESNENIVSVATNPPEINQIVVRPSAARTITWLVIGKQQWGLNGNNSVWSIPFNNILLAVITGRPGLVAREFSGFSFSYTNSNWSYTYGWNYSSGTDPNATAIAIGIQQWGFGHGSYTEAGTLYNVWTFTYPIQFSEIIFAVEVTGCNNVKTSQGTNYYYNLELNTVDIVSHGESYVLIIGKQQWGYQAVHGNAEQEFPLPLAFTNSPYTVAISTSNTGNHAACKGFTLSTIILDAGDGVNVDDNIGFIILGKQQWGLTGNDPGVGGASAQLSIPITALIFGQARTTSSEVLSSVFSVDVNNTSTLYIDSSNIQYKGGYAYLIGCKQQWGLSTGRTITYPISLLTLYSIVAIDAASGMDAVQVCDVNTANNTSAIIFQMRLTQGDILPDNMTGFYWILTGKAQQWGSLIVEGNSYVTVNLNINSNLFIVTGNSSSTNKPVQTGIVSNSQISFRIMETGSHTTYWVVLGS